MSVEDLGFDPLDRTRRISPPSGWGERFSRAFMDFVERTIARYSIHGDPPVYNTADFPWVAEIESEWQHVRAELDHVLEFRDRMPNFQDILKEVETIQTDDQWKTFFLLGIGMDCGQNAEQCPETMRLLAKIPGATMAFFSILSPNKHIPAHRGAYNGVLRYHLALMVPEPQSQCRVRIGDQVHQWREGTSLIFDDTFNHEVWNDTSGHRVVLFVDFARPLQWPVRWINALVLRFSAFLPILREASAKQKRWESLFYRRNASAAKER